MRIAFAGAIPYESFTELFVELELENGRKITSATISSPRPPLSHETTSDDRLNKILLECADALAGGKKMFWALLETKADELPYSDNDKLVEIIETLTNRGHKNQLDVVPQKAWLSVLKEARLSPKRPRDEVELYDFICELAGLRRLKGRSPDKTAIEAIDEIAEEGRSLERIFASIDEPLPDNQPQIWLDDVREILRTHAADYVDKFHDAVKNPQRFANFPNVPNRTVVELGKWQLDQKRSEGWYVIDSVLRYLAKARSNLHSKLPL
jgi:hypothetical protein